MKVPLALLTALLFSQQTEAKFNKPFWDWDNDEDVGEPLLLTPYLREGRIEEAQRAALVDDPTFLGVTSYAGYFTVNERFDSNVWFWFFPSADDCEEDPVVLWVNGGILDSFSMTGVFYELGPFIFNEEDDSLSLREFSWHRNQSVSKCNYYFK